MLQKNTVSSLLLLAWACSFGLLLTACGGSGFEPQITAVKAVTLQYGKTANIQVGGVHLRSSVQADLGAGCPKPVFASYSNTETLYINCPVEATGDLPLIIKSASGDVLFSTTLVVPQPQVKLTTSLGDITLELNPAAAPGTVKNFLNYVQQGYYKDTVFHRVIPSFVVQGGGYTTGMVPKPGQAKPISLETPNGLLNLRGTLAMARTNAADSATSEFFINLVDNPTLDYRSKRNPGYAVFGKVVKGLGVADTLATQSTTTVKGFENVPTTDVTITAAQQIQ